MPTSPAPVTAAPRQRQGRWKVWTRTLHIYASLLGLILTLFFGVTGFVLNHDDWFDLKATSDTRELTLPAELLAQPDPLTVVERVRADCGVTGALQVYELDPDALHLRFARPARRSRSRSPAPTAPRS